MSILRKYQPDPVHVLDFDTIEVEEKVKYIELSVWILDRREQILRKKVIPLVQVLWQHHDLEEVTWESEDDMKSCHPHLFEGIGKISNFEDEIF